MHSLGSSESDSRFPIQSYSLSDIQLKPKRFELLKKQVYKKSLNLLKSKSILFGKWLPHDEYEGLRLEIYNKELDFAYKNLIHQQYSKSTDLLQYVAPLERKLRNNYLKVSEMYNLLFSEGSEGRIRQFQNKLIKGIAGTEFEKSDYNNIHDFFWHSDRKKADQLRDLKKELDFLEQCYDQAVYNFELFFEKYIVDFLQQTINILHTAIKKQLLFKSDVTNCINSNIGYFSRNKYDPYTLEKQIDKTKDLLKSALTKHTLFGNYQVSFLTVAPLNIPKNLISKDIIKNFGDILFRLFKHRLTLKQSRKVDFKAYEERLKHAYLSNSFDKDSIKNEIKYKKNLDELYNIFPKFLKERPNLDTIFPGYFGRLELVEEESTINLHAHFLVLREKNFEKGFVSKFYLEELFKEVSNIWGCFAFKGSSIIDIRSKASPKSELETINDAINYLLVEYMLKGVKIQNKETWKDIIVATDGIRFERSGGLLAKNKLKEIAINYETEKSLLHYKTGVIEEFDGVNMLFGGRKKPNGDYLHEPIKLAVQDYLELETQNNYDLTKIQQDLLYNQVSIIKTRKIKYIKNLFYRKIENSLFGCVPLLDPIYQNHKLKLKSLANEQYITQWQDPFFFSDALKFIGEKEKNKNLILESQKFLDNYFGFDFSKSNYLIHEDSYFSYTQNLVERGEHKV